MAQTLFKLNPKAAAALKKPGRHSDGGGLYLSVSKTGGKSWVFFYKLNGKQREMGFGSFHAIGLAEARDKAAAARNDLANRIDPLDKRNQERARPAIPTFGALAGEYIDAHRHEWRNAKHAEQWTSTLTTHAAAIWNKPVDTIDTDDILAVLSPIWGKIPETARRLRGRIEAVLDAAKVRGMRQGENPARWKGHLAALLAKAPKLSRGHHAALTVDAIPSFWTKLAEFENMSALALRFVLLTAARSGEVRGAKWDEIDFEAAIWTVPAERMKAARVHRVPLSVPALALLQKLRELKLSGYLIFPGSSDQALSDMTLSIAMKRLGAEGTPHGLRSSFRDWAGDRTNFAREVAEAALAHVVGDQAEQAYRRSDALEKRRALMTAWANFCITPPVGKVVPFSKQA